MKTQQFIAAIALLFAPPSFHACAAGIDVTSADDSGEGSLRAAAGIAADGDVISFNIPTNSAGYDSSSGKWTVKLTGGEIKFDKSLTFKGGGKIILDGDNASRIFNYNGNDKSALTLDGLAFQNGNARGGAADDAARANGGAVFTNGRLAAVNCVFSTNSSGGSGGAAHALGGITVADCAFTGNAAEGDGGALCSHRGIIAVGSVFFGNETKNDGSAFGSALSAGHVVTAVNSSFVGNRTNGDKSKAAIFARESAHLCHSTIADNSGVGVYVFMAGKREHESRACNSIIAGNAAKIQAGFGDLKLIAAFSSKNIIGDSLIEGVTSGATRAAIFGENTADAAGVIKPLAGGIADKTANALRATEIKIPDDMKTTDIIAALQNTLQKDISGEHRSAFEKVSYGAKE
jgi:hypothetical protein